MCIRDRPKLDPAPQVTVLHGAGTASMIELPVAAIPDTTGSGRYPALKEEVPSLPDHVVYRPADLASLGKRKLGLDSFGKAAGANAGTSSLRAGYRPLPVVS